MCKGRGNSVICLGVDKAKSKIVSPRLLMYKISDSSFIQFLYKYRVFSDIIHSTILHTQIPVLASMSTSLLIRCVILG